MLNQFLERAAKAYYDGEPIVSDEVFDRLAESAGFEQVGAYSGDIPHTYPLYSLQKVFVGEDEIPSSCVGVANVKMPKLDGACIAATYIDGKLHRALTRGDGEKGKDITDKILSSDFHGKIPKEISRGGVIQVSIEVLAKKSEEVKNPRNYAAGALNLKSVQEFHTRELEYVAHTVQPLEHSTYSDTLLWLQSEGFNTPTSQSWNDYPQDGTVYRVDNNALFDSLGFTAHHPRGAYALKERKEAVVTTLLSVTWQVGKSGKVTPVANLEPVDIDGATVSKASLHNAGFIESLDLNIGDRVLVIRAGEIIPYITGKAA